MLSRVSSSKTRRNRTWNLRSMQCWRRTTKNFSEKWRVGYSPSFVFDSEKTGNTWKYRNRTGSSRNTEQRTLPIPCHSIEIREKVLFQRDDRFYRWKYRLPYTEVGQKIFISRAGSTKPSRDAKHLTLITLQSRSKEAKIRVYWSYKLYK